MIKSFLSIILLCSAVLTSGCIGGKSVETSYLRVGSNFELNATCEDVNSSLPTLAVKRFTSLPALDRETVIIAKGPVLKPDYRWSWEGTPCEIFDIATETALGCMKNYEVVAPYRPGPSNDFILSGVIMAFEVQRSSSDFFKVAVRYSLWDSSGKKLLARKLIAGSAPVKTLAGKSLAEAAQEALGSVLDQTATWIDGISE
ncbi:hypothetical protein [Maridesulfovibrio frigidus]|uniref:hypothetical protein n=1 Tax=Maridesulfovibrio frigidus TaxID=340956 RepID=UPI0004E0E6A6|nr:hypothetical protein [Maridesulfovibrio frigidus]